MTRHVETTATRLSHAGEKLSVVVQSDVTSIKHAEQQKLEVQAKLLDADKAESLGVLAGGVAHDFNNLLVGILSNASFVLENLAPGSVEHECLKDVELASERAAELCRQLLAFSGRGQFTFEDLRVDALLEDSLRLLRASIPRAVDLEVTRPDRELPVIQGDASQIRQVLFNLVSNGAEAVVGSGKVRVTVGVEELTPERIRAASHGGETQPGPHVYVRVVDDGAGMAEDVRARIFEPFFTTKFTGRGLGLAAVQGIVHGHRGALEVETGAGRGTRVTALFPVAVDAADGGEAISICPTVLVVDDEDFVRSAAHRALAHAGYEVVEAASGAEVLEMLDERLDELALVLLDITMPGMSGEEIYTRIRARSRSLPVLFSSGLPDLDDGGIVAPEGRTYFIRKPYRAQELVERVRVILEETA
jgi:signal transduction histidine kinase